VQSVKVKHDEAISLTWDCIIVGGGAAGLWAAGTAASRGRKVLVLEKNNKPGIKILMSGGTRCNITHDCSSAEIADAFGPEGRALLSPLSRLSPQQVIATMHELGVDTKSEPGGKVFPVSDSAVDVRDAVLRRATNSGATVCTGIAVLDVLKTENGFQIATEGKLYQAESVLLCTGGLSYRECGTTGDGYPWLERLGHTLNSRRPALVPLVSHAEFCKPLQGTTHDDVLVRVIPHADYPKQLSKNRHVYRGGFLWTHFGCSGPTAMNVSRWLTELERYDQSHLMIDLLPDESNEALVAWLRSGKEVARNKQVKNYLQAKFSQRVTEAIIAVSKVRDSIPMAELSSRDQSEIIATIKSLRLPIHGTRGYGKAEVTAGGVKLKEVDFQTMESKIVPGLYLAGEILDLDGPIGGYNFQAAWSTGHTAGLHM
jgi:predicted Rossmann fold flavoprotein